jgi:hypothetical protein
MDLEEFRNKLGSRRANRQDIVTTKYEAVQLPKDASVGIRIEDHDDYPLTHHAHTQLASQARIPMQYYEKLTRESPRLLCENLNLGRPYRTLLFRILDGTIVAIMSDQYRIIDNDTVFEEVYKNMADSYHDLDVHQCSLTDSRMYVIFLEPTFAFSMQNYDVVPGIIIRNSETGEGAFRADMYLHIKDADVGLIGDNQAYRTHRGKRLDQGLLNFQEDLTEEELTLRRDMLMGSAYDPKPFTQWIMRMRANMSRTTKEPLETVTKLVTENWMPRYGEPILKQFLKSEELTKWTLAIATATIAKLELPDERFRIERIAGRIASEPLQTTQTNLEE